MIIWEDHHSRSFKRLNDSFIMKIVLRGKLIAYLHFAPEEEIELVGNGTKGKISGLFEGSKYYN